jgi:hypothetical protein
MRIIPERPTGNLKGAGYARHRRSAGQRHGSAGASSRTTALAGAKDLLESGVHALAETLPASLIDTMRTQLAQAEAKGNPPKPEW